MTACTRKLYFLVSHNLTELCLQRLLTPSAELNTVLSTSHTIAATIAIPYVALDVQGKPAAP